MLSYNLRAIHADLPFLKEGSVLYYPADPARQLSRRLLSRLQGLSRTSGCLFVYVPDLLGRLRPKAVEYILPGYGRRLKAEDAYRNIGRLAGLDAQEGFLCRFGATCYFCPVDDPSDAGIENVAASLFMRCMEEENAAHTEEPLYLVDYCLNADIKVSDAYELSIESFPEPESEFDARAQSIIKYLQEFMKEYKLSIEELKKMLDYPVKLSRLKITRQNKIYLVDWEGEPEVKMDPMTKAVYFFYLRHSVGIAQKNLIDYEQEILGCYKRVSGRGNPEAMRQSVSNLVNPLNNNLNVCLSRIKRAFTSIVDDRIAASYYVSGHYAGPRRITLDRSLVEWEE